MNAQLPEYDYDNPDFQRGFEIVRICIEFGKYVEAIEHINDLLQSYPDNSYLYYSRGYLRYYLNDKIRARADLYRARLLGFHMQERFINFISSREFMVKEIMSHYTSAEMDPSRDLRPVIKPADTLQGKLRPQRDCYDVFYYDLSVRLNPEEKSISGSNKVYFTAVQKSEEMQIDLFDNLEVSSIRMNDRVLNYTRLYNAIFINLDDKLIPGEEYILEIDYSGSPREAPRAPWDGGFVWETNRNKYWVGVACEHLGASSWWPCKDHLSDKPDSMGINLIVPDGYYGVSNGNLVSKKEEVDGWNRYEWFVSYPINNYNVTVYMGDFVNFTEVFENNTGEYNADYYVLPHNLKKAKKYYSQTREIAVIFEDLFGDYPFMRDGIGMVEAPYEGMEHQGAIAIGDAYKGKDRRDYWTKDFDYLVVHELAHEWWGNALAIGDMADAWINEGFATYAECLFAEAKYGYRAYVDAIAVSQQRVFNIWPLVGERNINANTFIGNDIYHKGASMLNNLRCTIDDDELFMKIIRDYYNKYKYRITTTTDFTDLVSEYTGKDYSSFFDIFLYKTQPPILECRYYIDNKRKLTFIYRWKNVADSFSMPFCININNKQTFRLTGTAEPQTFTMGKVSSFYLPNEFKFKSRDIPHNSFTYYWTEWIKDEQVATGG